ncbi:MAG TPA: AMP-binding protein [Caulobacteraceae bacterium]|jgi:feruloyl-CoA synthase
MTEGEQPRVTVEHRADGSVLIRNTEPAPAHGRSVLERLEHWARARPEHTFLAEREGEGWRRLSYAQAWGEVRELAARLLPLGLSAERPLMLLAPNGIAHAELALAGMLIGVPVAPVSTAYAAPAAGGERLAEVVGRLTPGAVYVDAGEGARAALRAAGAGEARLLEWSGVLRLAPASAEAAAEAAARVGPGTIAKFLFTSGSSGAPKAVVVTQEMLCSNLAALEAVWPQLVERPPVLVDWLPWHHTFGGNVCLGTALHFGGTLYIDEGRPRAGEVELTVENLKRVRPSVYFNVPAGYEALLPYLEGERAFAERFFGGLEFLFNAGAALSPSTRERLEAAATAAIGRCPPIVGSWGATETAPAATMTGFDSPPAGHVGPPLPGVTIKLSPDRGRLEMRVKGPNVTPGYWRAPQATAACFDEQGFYRSGDAGRLADEARPEAGIAFDGRLAENFKLSTGAWVNAGAVRQAAIEAGRPLVLDAVVAGHDEECIGVLLWADAAAVTRVGEAEARRRIGEGLARYNAGQIGSSTRIALFELLDPPPDVQSGELTAKGTLNAARVLERRREAVARLFG